MKITLTGQVPSQKNSKQIAINRATGKPFVMSNDRVKSWQNDVAVQLLAYRIKEPIETRVEMSIMFYVKDNRRRDLDNMIASVNDALVSAQIIKDDSWQWLRIASIDAQLDKTNPRAEIEIIPLS